MITLHSTHQNADSARQTTQQTVTPDLWHGCYSRGWGGELVPEAFAHPAKVSFLLAQRIYQHALDMGFIARGGTVLDPFGGVGGFAYGALFGGLQWVGVELEEKFVTLGRANIAMWNEKYSHRMWTWGRATLLQGDSRKLLEVVGQADLVVSSPPFGRADSGGGALARAMRGEGNYTVTTSLPKNSYSIPEQGDAPGNLAALPPGNLDLVISSPPFLQSTGGAPQPTNGAIDSALIARHSVGQGATHLAYGGEVGQLGGMTEGSIDAVISSPPYEGTAVVSSGVQRNESAWGSGGDLTAGKSKHYGKSVGQIGESAGETFWSAARAIVEQCYLALKPGGHAIWVTKRYVKGGKIVEFTEQWIRLCESVGFVMKCHHHAMLVEEGTAQGDIFGGVQSKRKERKSFFRRLAERKGSPRIDWEDVVCMVKPLQ